MERSVILVRPPDCDGVYKYVLLLPRLSQGFGGGGGMNAIAVDELYIRGHGDTAYYEGIRAGERVVVFPAEMPFHMIERAQVDFMTTEQAARMQYEESRIMEALQKEFMPPATEEVTAGEEKFPGQYA